MLLGIFAPVVGQALADPGLIAGVWGQVLRLALWYWCVWVSARGPNQV
jgi:hypothetical protein